MIAGGHDLKEERLVVLIILVGFFYGTVKNDVIGNAPGIGKGHFLFGEIGLINDAVTVAGIKRVHIVKITPTAV